MSKTWDAQQHVADAMRRGVDPVSSYIDIQLNQLAWDEQHCVVLPNIRGRVLRDLEAIRDEQERQKLARKPRLIWSRD